MIAIVTDSTSDISQELAGKTGIAVVPLTVIFGEEQLLDGVDIQKDDFYPRLAAAAELPHTSQPSPHDFSLAYKAAFEKGAEHVFSLHITAGLSGTLQSAQLAAADFEDRVTVVDSLSVSSGLKLFVLEAARLAEEKVGKDELRAELELLKKRIAIYVTLDTLTYLQKGGRIGRAQAFVGGVLKVKPMLLVSDGVITPYQRVRSLSQGMSEMLRAVRELGTPVRLRAMHSAVPKEAEAWLAMVTDAFPGVPVELDEVGPVIGTYAGPGALGLACLTAAPAGTAALGTTSSDDTLG